MNKEEILAKSIKENVYGDECEKKMRIQRDAFTVWGVIILGIVIMIIKLCRTESPADIIALFFCIAATGSLYEGIATKKKSHILFAILFFVLTGYYLYRFCMRLF